MKKINVLLLIIMIFVSLTGVANALNTPGVSTNHGVITGMLVSGTGVKITGEYGFDTQLAIIGTVGDPYTRLGAKYQVDNNLAVLAGVTDDSPFFGVNGSRFIRNRLFGIYDVDVLKKDSDLALFYELGVKVDLQSNVDLRAGLIGFTTDDDFPELELGIAYKF